MNLLVLLKIVKLHKESHHPGHAESESSTVVAFAEEPEPGQGKATSCREEVPDMAGLQSSLDPRLQVSLSSTASQLHGSCIGSFCFLPCICASLTNLGLSLPMEPLSPLVL